MQRKIIKKSTRSLAKRSQNKISKTPVVGFVVGFITLFILGIFYIVYKPLPCANSISCLHDMSGIIQPKETSGTFMGEKVTVPQDLLTSLLTNKPASPSVLGTTTASTEKKIFVDLTHQRLYAYQGTTLFMNTLISSGKWHPTPTGTFHIWSKLVATRMTGGSGADYYDLPNVPYTMYFYNDFALHGAYWHNNFGHPMSHGCVNMRIEDAHKLFDWVDPVTTGYVTNATDQDPGTTVVVYCTQNADGSCQIPN